jgi:hypothetical protein
MDKQQILDEIKRTAVANGGVALGRSRFLQETGIKESDWFGKYWSRWNDAVEEAGVLPNKLQDAYAEHLLVEKYVKLIRELGRIPVKGELRLKRRSDPSFPNDKTFERFGSKSQLLSKAVEYCQNHSGFDDIARLCVNSIPNDRPTPENEAHGEVIGSVYLLKSGGYYKIGRTNAMGRREYELAIQLPEKIKRVHEIRTDDPVGIEAYWHTRFASKRAKGEWFALDGSDVTAFRRRKFM